MRRKSFSSETGAAADVGEIRRRTREQFLAVGKIWIVLLELRSVDRIAELCRREGIAKILYYG